MKLLTSILLGLIQGLCEFLPVSSSGHLALAHSLFGLSAPDGALAFDVLLHLGTLAAVVLLFYKDIWLLIRSFFTLLGKIFNGNFKFSEYSVGERLVVLLLIAVLPLIPAAFLSDSIEALMSYPLIVGILLMVNAVMLWVSDRFAGEKALEDVKPRNALVVGLFQLFALMPGISRSGSTITGGLTQKFDRTLAVRFSFLLSIPAILGASVLKLPAFVRSVPDGKTLLIYLAGALTAMIVGICAIKLVSFLAKRASFRPFAVYCLLAGGATVIYTLCTMN